MLASRLQRHAFLAVASLAILFIAWFAGESSTALDRLSIVSAYLFLLSISFVLLMGPWHALRTGRATTNNLLRRDVAIWSAIAGLVHLVAGAMQSMTPVYLERFVRHADNLLATDIREPVFLWSTVIGFVVGALLILLLALSNNRSMVVVGQPWWKRLHRASYFVFGLTVLHGFGFQLLESRHWVGYALIGTISLVVCLAQVLGVRAVTRW